jgi:ABC-2 type transport system permease protein
MSAFKAARAYARLSGAYLRANLQAAMEYRANFLVQVLGMMLNNAAFIFFWRVLLDRAGGVSGYGFKDVMFLWALASSAFGLGHILFGNVRGISALVVKGELDVYLLQPKNVLFHCAVSRSVVPAWGDLAYGFILLVAVNGFDPARLALFALFVVSGAVLYMSSFAIVESLSFFAGSVQGLSRAFLELILSSTLYPDRIYGPGVRWIFYSLLPAAYIVFIPLKAFRGLDLAAAALSLGASVLYCLAAYAIFSLGLRRYESGNLIGTRT